MRSFYSDVLYTKATKQPSLLQTGNNSRSRERKSSFVSISQQFSKSVKCMEEVVLVPTRLLDLEVKAGEANIPDLVSCGQNNNLFEVFHLLKKFRDRMETMARDEEIGSLCCEVDDSLMISIAPSPKVPIDCDSGLWSSLSSSASRESIEDVDRSVYSDDRSCSSGESEAGSVDSLYIVKKSLDSAKSLCTVLVEMSSVAQFIISRYLQEMQCDLCE